MSGARATRCATEGSPAPAGLPERRVSPSSRFAPRRVLACDTSPRERGEELAFRSLERLRRFQPRGFGFCDALRQPGAAFGQAAGLGWVLGVERGIGERLVELGEKHGLAGQ